jgi:hypothetical protein
MSLLLLVDSKVSAADPTTADCLAASESSLKLRAAHKLRATREQLLVCADANCPADLRLECVRRVSELNGAIPTLVFEAKDAAGNDLSAVTVSMDGQPLVERLEGSAISLDPGEHRFVFVVSGEPSVEKTFVLQEGEKGRRERILFGNPAKVPYLGIKTESAQSGIGAQKIFGIAAASVGIASLTVGTIFGLQSIAKHNDASSVCPDQCADQNGVNLWNDARSAGNISTVGFLVGIVGLAGGAALWFSAPSNSSVAPQAQLGFGPGALQLKSVW